MRQPKKHLVDLDELPLPNLPVEKHRDDLLAGQRFWPVHCEHSSSPLHSILGPLESQLSYKYTTFVIL